MQTIKKILYVEDDADIQEIALMALEDIGGYEVRLCSSGAQALEETSNFIPDLILMDVMMPDMDGVETYQALLKIEEMKNVPIIFMTAKVQSHEIKEYLKLGAIGVISKPFDPITLAEEINRIYSNSNY